MLLTLIPFTPKQNVLSKTVKYTPATRGSETMSHVGVVISSCSPTVCLYVCIFYCEIYRNIWKKSTTDSLSLSFICCIFSSSILPLVSRFHLNKTLHKNLNELIGDDAYNDVLSYIQYLCKRLKHLSESETTQQSEHNTRSICPLQTQWSPCPAVE